MDNHFSWSLISSSLGAALHADGCFCCMGTRLSNEPGKMLTPISAEQLSSHPSPGQLLLRKSPSQGQGLMCFKAPVAKYKTSPSPWKPVWPWLWKQWDLRKVLSLPFTVNCKQPQLRGKIGQVSVYSYPVQHHLLDLREDLEMTGDKKGAWKTNHRSALRKVIPDHEFCQNRRWHKNYQLLFALSWAFSCSNFKIKREAFFKMLTPG